VLFKSSYLWVILYLYPIDVPGDPSEKTGKVCAAIDLYKVIEAIR